MATEQALQDWQQLRWHEAVGAAQINTAADVLASGLRYVWSVQADPHRAGEMLAVAGMVDAPAGYPDWSAYLALRLARYALLYGLLAAGEPAWAALLAGDAATGLKLVQQAVDDLRRAGEPGSSVRP